MENFILNINNYFEISINYFKKKYGYNKKENLTLLF